MKDKEQGNAPRGARGNDEVERVPRDPRARTMAELIDKGTWVEIHRVVLPPGERAPQVPPDTQGVPLEMRVKGFLVAAATLGNEAEIMTPAGRRLRGTLTEINPTYTHGFGPPIPELGAIGEEVRARLRNRQRQ